MSNSLWPRGLQHTRHPCLWPTPRVWSNSCPSSWWCIPIISSSVPPFSSWLQSFPASGSFPMSLFIRGQIIGFLASASVLPMNFWGWFSLGWTGWISLQSKGLSRVFSNTTVQKASILWRSYCPTLTSIHDYSYYSSHFTSKFILVFILYILHIVEGAELTGVELDEFW